MTSKKNAFIATLIMLLKKGNGMNGNDISAKNVIENFKVKNNYLDFKQNYGTNMFGKNKLLQI